MTDVRSARSVRTLDHWIGGASTAPGSGVYLDRRSPADQSVVSQVAFGTPSDVDDAVAAAAAALPGWRATAPVDRGRLLAELARAIDEHTEALVDAEVAETGKIRAATYGEIAGARNYFEFYAALVNLPGGELIDLGEKYHIYTRYEPFGVVGVITPWNVPINQAARGIAPALAAGNVVVAKPSEYTSASTVLLAQLATEVGFPDGVFNVVLGDGANVGAPLVAHPQVRKVAFTGSVAAGRAIGHIAADRIIPLTLELGGKSANIVFADADLELAAQRSVVAFTGNAGQVCSAGTRLLVQRSIHDSFVEKLVAETSKLQLGVDVGPLITEDQFRKVNDYFTVAADEGLTAATGGSPAADDADQEGWYAPPTIYTGVSNDQRLAREEVFGPVVVVIPFDTDAEAVAIANDSDYGLVAGLWTTNLSRAIRVADLLEAGQVFVNTWTTGAVQTPFGGYKMSGYGREKGIEALHHYCQVKCVTVAL